MSAAAAVQVSQRIVVTGGHLKAAWVPEPLRDRNGQVIVLRQDASGPIGADEEQGEQDEEQGKQDEEQGKQFLALSSSDYMLGQFLFGTANKQVAGKRVRNLPDVAIVRRLWKARERMQREAFQQYFRTVPERGPESDDALLAGLFEGEGGEGAEAEAEAATGCLSLLIELSCTSESGSA